MKTFTNILGEFILSVGQSCHASLESFPFSIYSSRFCDVVNKASSSESRITQFFPQLKLTSTTDPKFVGEKRIYFKLKKWKNKKMHIDLSNSCVTTFSGMRVYWLIKSLN